MTTRHRQATSTRINRKARRAAKMQPEVPAVAAAPAPVLVSGPGYGRYVGRVGALAVALGLGAAVATGYGLGIPAVASAENGSESTENTPNDPPNPQDPPAEPGGNGSGSGTGAGSSGPTVPEMQLPEHSGSQQPSNTSSPSEMQVSVSGGAQLTGSGAQNGSGSGTTQTPTTHSQTPTPSPTQEPLVNNGIPSGGTTPTTSQTESGYVAPTGTTTPAAPQGNPTPNVIPNQSGHVTPLLTGTTTTTVIHNNGETNQPGNGAARLSGGQPNLQTFSTAAGTSFTSQLSLATASGTPAPAALVDQPDNPIEALMGAPAALANIAATAISMFFNGLLNPGPGTPAPPVMLFVVLGWAQRELARTFFNQSPNGVADNIGTNEDTGVTIPVLSNDTDGDLGVGDVLTVTDYTQPANGSVALNPNGTFTYTPDANFNGTDTFTYTVSDEASPWHMHGLGGFFGGGAHAAAPTTVTITVGSVNDAPVAVDDSFTTDEDHPLTGNPNVHLAGNDTDVDGDTLTAVSFTQPTNGGAVANNGDGTWTYTPGANAQALDDGESLQDSFTYTLSDGHGGTDIGTVNITVNGVNDAPVAVDDAFTTDEDHSLTGDPNFYLAGNDTDVDLENLTAVSFTTPTNGGAVTNNGDGTWTYTPGTNAQTLGAGDTLTDTFTYEVTDGTATDTGLVTITVTGINDAPITNPDAFTVGEDGVLTGDPNVYLAANDTDIDGDTLTVVGFTQPTNGGSVTDNGDGTWTYTPNAQDLDDGETRTDTFTYTVSDGTTMTDGLVTITVTGANDAPVAVDDAFTTDEDHSLTGDPNFYLAGNDTDVDLENLTAVSFTTPTNGGAVTNNGDGTWTYTPGTNAQTLGAGDTLTDTFTYEVTDGTATDTGLVTITVTGINDAPITNPDAFTVGEDGVLTGDPNVYLAANDTDIDGDTLTVVGFTQPTNGGSVTDNGDGTWTYTPNAQDLDDGETRTDTFTYTVSDGTTMTDGLVTITVTGANDAPVAGADAATTDEDSSVGVNVLTNDTDADGDALTVIGFTPPISGGSVVDNGDGTFTYTPGANAQALGAGDSFDDTFTYTVSDGTTTDTGLVTITVTGSNDAPVAVDDAFSTGEDSPPLTFNLTNLLNNDTDAENDPLTPFVGSLTQPAHGSLVFDSGTGTFTYTPSAAAQGLDDGETFTDTFSYTVLDGNGGFDTATVTITINGANDAPVAVDDAFTTNEDTPLTGDPNFYLAGNDTDVDLENLTAVSFTQPTNGGTVVANPDGTWTYTPGTNAQTLGAGDTLTDTFTYEVSDGTATDTGLVTITVTGINDAPNAVNDLANTDEDTATTGNVLTNDTDIDGGPLQVTTTTPMNGTYGTVTINPDGSYTYTPYNGSAPGQGTTVGATGGTITLNDPSQVTQGDNTFGGHDYVAVVFTPSATGTYEFGQTGALVDTMIYVFGGATFDPSAPGTLLDFNDDSGTADTCGTQGFCPRVDPTLTAGQPVTIVITTYSAGAVLGLPQNLYTNGPGTFAGSAAGADALAEGETGTDTFTYEVSDGNGGTDTATLSVTITGTNDAPVAADDLNATDEETPVTGNVLTNDTDIDNGDVLTVTTTTPMTGNYGTVTIGTDGSYTYTPGPNAQTLAAGETATDTFTYTVTDTHGAFDNATLAVTVTGLNDAPVAVDDAFSVGEDGALTGDPNVYLAANDTDIDGDTLTAVSFTQPTNGGSVVDNGDGTWTYTPGANAQALGNGDSLQDTFTYTVTDGNGGSDIGTVTITVTGANDTPVAGEDTATTNEDSAVNVNVLANDSDIDGDTLTVVSFTQPDNGGAVIDNGDGTFTYTPGANAQALGAGASLDDTFTYTVSDGNGGNATGTVTITVTGSNDAPVAVDDAFSTGEDSPPLTFNLTNLLNNDTDAENDPLTPFVGSLTQPAHGSLVFDSGTGTFTYTPSAAAQGLDDGETFTDTFSYTVLDGNGGFDTATVTITINGANDAPVAVDDAFTTNEDTPLTGDPNFYLAGNDTDVDLENLTAVSFTQPTNGGTVVANPDGTWTYTPGTNAQTLGAGDTLTDTFTYEVSDGTATDTGLVTITVTGINDAPNAVNDLANTDEDTATTGNVLTNDTDIDGGPLQVTTTTPMNGTYGTVTINPDGSYTYTPYNGSAPGHGTTVGATGGTITLNDPTQVTQGTTVFFGSGDSPRNYIAFVFTPSATQSYLFGQPSGPIDTMLALYNGPFDPASPENWIAFNDDSGGGTCGGYSCPQVTANLTAGQPVTIVITTFGVAVPLGLPQNLYTTGPGTFANTSAGADALAEGQTGTDTFTYEVSDGNGGTDTATLTITITGTNDTPVAADDLNATNEETPVSGNVLTNDTDVDNGDVLTVTTTTPMTGNYGTVTIGTDGSYTYTPGTAAQGLAAGETATETFTYSITDTHGATDSADLMITLTGVNDAPVANPDAFGTDEDHPLTGDPNAFLGINDTDADGDLLTFTGFTQPTNGGIVVDNGNGTWTYNPNAQDLAGGQTRTDTFTYFVSDGTATTEGLVTVTITGLDDAPTLTASPGGTTYTENDAPVAVDSGITLTDIDTPIMVAAIISINNAQTGDTLHWTEPTVSNIHIQYNDGQQIVLVGNASQAEYEAALQSITFESIGDDPVAGNRTINFTIVTPDAQNTVSKSVTVVAVNDNPVGQPDEYTTAEDTALVIAAPGLLANDSDVDNAVIKATIWVNPNPATGSVVVNNDGSFTFTPAPDFNGTTSFYYAANDGLGGVADPTLVTVHVTPVDETLQPFDTVTLNTGGSPSDIAISPDGKRAYVTNTFGNALTVIDVDPNSPNFNEVIDTNTAASGVQGITVGGDAHTIAITPDGKRLYVTHYGSSGGVSVVDIDPASATYNKVIDTNPSASGVQDITVGSFPAGITINHNGTRAYVVNSNSNSVSVIDIDPASATYNQVVDADPTTGPIDSITVPNGPFKVAVSPDGKRIYVSHITASAVTVIDIDPSSADYHKVIDTDPIAAGINSIAIGGVPEGIAVTPSTTGARAYVVTQGGNSVAVIDIDPTSLNYNKLIDANPSVGGIQQIPVSGVPVAIAISPDGKRAYATNLIGNTVAVIDTDPTSVTYNQVIDTNPSTVAMDNINVPANPGGIAITPDGTRAYVTSYTTGTVTMIYLGEADTSIPELNFESGSLAGWNIGTQNGTQGATIDISGTGVSFIGGPVTYVGPFGTYVYTPSGTGAASLSPDSSQTFGQATTSLGLTPAEQQAITASSPSSVPTDAAWMSRMVYLDADTTYTMAWNFISTDSTSWGDGSITTLVYQGGGPAPTVLINGDAGNYALLGYIADPGDYSTGSYESTGWQNVTYKVSQSGDYLLGFSVFNGGDTAVDPVLLVDNAPGSTTRDGQPYTLTPENI